MSWRVWAFWSVAWAVFYIGGPEPTTTLSFWARAFCIVAALVFGRVAVTKYEGGES